MITLIVFQIKKVNPLQTGLHVNTFLNKWWFLKKFPQPVLWAKYECTTAKVPGQGIGSSSSTLSWKNENN